MGGQDIINLDSSSEEDVSQLQNKEERDGIQQVGFNEIEPGDDPNEQDMDLGDDVIVSNQSVLHETAQLVATRGVKRARVQSTQNEPSVRLVFRSLTRYACVYSSLSDRPILCVRVFWSAIQLI